MTERIEQAAIERAIELRIRLKRHKLIFVQCGALFEVLRQPLIDELGGTVVRAVDLVSTDPNAELTGPLIVTDVEEFALRGESGGTTLGELRFRVDQALDAVDVCLFSRVPRVSYAAVPGSSIIEDAQPCCLPLLDPEERLAGRQDSDEAALPAVGLAANPDIPILLRESLKEMGTPVLAALDYAVYEAGERRNFLQLLDAREFEAVRGAGHASVGEEGTVVFTTPRHLTQFHNALAEVLSELRDPQPELPQVSSGLWVIERSIRHALRRAAVAEYGDKWRKSVLGGDLPGKVLERARLDTNVTARSVAEIRDPLEWLTLGELMQVVESKPYDGLGVDAIVWRRFNIDVVPIRNRLSHMRLLKKRDRETVQMWVTRIRGEFPD